MPQQSSLVPLQDLGCNGIDITGEVKVSQSDWPVNEVLSVWTYKNTVYICARRSASHALSKVSVTTTRCKKGEIPQADQVIRNQVQLLLSIRHENVCSFEGVTYHVPHQHGIPGLVFEYVEHEIMGYVASNQANRSPRIIMELTQGVSFLHSKNVIHGNLIPNNLRVSASGQLKIINFDLSRIGEGSSLNPNGLLPDRDPRYAAPELVLPPLNQPETITFASDVWMYAMSVLQLAEGGNPADGLCVPFNHIPLPTRQIDYIPVNYRLIKAIHEGDRPMRDCYQKIPQWIWNLISQCWQAEPKDRPTILAVCDEICEKYRQANLGSGI